MKELTKKQKLEVIEECIKDLEREPEYLCALIPLTAYHLGMISFLNYSPNTNGNIATDLIPELLTFKPEDKEIGEAWFMWDKQGHERRREVLTELRDLIKKPTIKKIIWGLLKRKS
jgi:hypothetical protein